MRYRKISAAIFCLSLIISLGIAYEGEGTGTEAAQCVDGIDNDNSSAADGTGTEDLPPDPACTRPYHLDDSEFSMYDTGITWVVENGDLSSNATEFDGPSMFFGSQTIHEQGDEDVIVHEDMTFNEEYRLGYMLDSDEAWGGDENRTLDVDEIPDDWAPNEHPAGGIAFSNPPHPDSSDAEIRCGDSIILYDDYSNDELTVHNCPQDRGLPANQYDLPWNEDYSESTISDNLGDIGRSVDGDYNDERVEYNINMEVYGPSNDPDDGGTTHDITGDETGNDDPGDHLYDFSSYGSWSNGPDFYRPNEEEIWMVYPDEEEIEFDVATTDYLGDDDWETTEDFSGSMESTYTECSGTNSSECEYEEIEDVCTSEPEEGTLTHYQLADGNTSTHRTNSNVFKLEDSGTYEYSVDDSESNTVETVVEYDSAYNEGKEYEYCPDDTETIEEASCSAANCTANKSEVTYWEEGSKGHYSSYSTADFELSYHEVSLVDDMVFSLDPEDNDDTESSVSVREGLFAGDSFGFDGNRYNGESDSGDADGGIIPYIRNSGTTYFSYGIEEDDQHHGTSESVSLSTFEIQLDDNENDFESRRMGRWRVKADSEYGHADGFVMMTHDVINEGEEDQQKLSDWTLTGNTTHFGEENCMGCNSLPGDSDFVNLDLVEDLMKEEGIDGCSGNYTSCVASVDLYMENINEWEDNWGRPSADPADGLAVDVKGPYHTSTSMGVGMMYSEHSSDDSYTHFDDGPPEDPGGGNGGDGCDINTDNNWEAHMEGPAVNEDHQDEHQAAYEGCIEEHSSCILHGDEVPEGHVANIANPEVDVDYQAGGDSPDWQVCLDIENQDNPDDDPGGFWYNIDGEEAQDYLHSDHELIENGDSDDENHISYYWRENPGPDHPEYNPRGGEEGLPIENNCGNPTFDGEGGVLQDNEGLQCSSEADQRTRLNSEGFTYSFYTERARDDDYHPQGDEEETFTEPVFEGYVISLKDMSDQLEPGMVTTRYNMSDDDSNLEVDKWYSTLGDDENADRWSIAVDPSWSVDATGEPYPPWGAYYRDEGQARESHSDESISKPRKVFGNSYAAVAGPALDGESDYNNNNISEGDGVWIDPDDLRWAWEAEGGDKFQWPDENYDGSVNDWSDMMRLDIDLTGPDSGLGYDVPSMEGYSHRDDEYGNDNTLVWGDIVWQTEDDSGVSDPYGGASHPVEPGVEPVSEIHSELEPYMCGDDRGEFLIEEMGEAPNSEQLTGPYGCTTKPNMCFDSGSNQFVDNGEYLQMNEPGEESGRLKQDEEYCGTNPDDLGTWYDQDFKQEACNENSLYGGLAKRWIDSDYVQSHPHAVYQGIDDSWNDYMAQKRGEFDEYERYDAEADWDTDTDFESEKITPVDTGTNRTYTGSLGFCAGDDASEYMITQQSQTRFLESDNDVIGVAANSDSCVLEEDYSEEEGHQLYEEGERQQIVSEGSTQEIGCFDGQWWGDWPVVFLEDVAQTGLGETTYSSFTLINPESTSRDFELELSTGHDDLETMTAFSSTGTDEMTVTVPAGSSRTFEVEITGSNEIDTTAIPGENLELQAQSNRGDLEGYDSLEVIVGESPEGGVGSVQGERRDVPGLQTVQIVVIALITTAVFVFFSS